MLFTRAVLRSNDSFAYDNMIEYYIPAQVDLGRSRNNFRTHSAESLWPFPSQCDLAHRHYLGTYIFHRHHNPGSKSDINAYMKVNCGKP